MKFYNYARKRRQLKFLAKQLRKQLAANGGVLTQQTERLLAKIKKILLRKKPIISRSDFIKAIGVAAVLFGLGMSTPATAQNFALPESMPFGLDTINDYAFPTFVDLDADGDLDLFAGQYGERYGYEPGFLFFENTSTGANPVLGTAEINPFGTVVADGVSYSKPTFADLDGDGDLDLLSGSDSGEFYYYENVGTKTAPAFDDFQLNPFGLDSVFNYSFPEFVDLDGDGDFDLLSGEVFFNAVAQMDYGNFVFFQNIGTPTAPSFASPVTNPFGLSPNSRYNTPAVGDVDGDGDLDIMGPGYDGTLVYLENTGSVTGPQFASALINPFGIVVDSGPYLLFPDLADVDNDGDVDLVVSESYGAVKFYENTTKNPVGLKEVVSAFDLEVFPNPVGDVLVLQTEQDLKQIEIFDVFGKKMTTQSLQNQQISTALFSPGIYSLRAVDRKGNVVVKKFQKM